MDIKQENKLEVNEAVTLSNVSFSKPVAIQADGIITVKNGNSRFSYGQTEATETSPDSAGPNYNASLSANVSYSVSGENSVSSITFKSGGKTIICSTSKPE